MMLLGVAGRGDDEATNDEDTKELKLRIKEEQKQKNTNWNQKLRGRAKKGRLEFCDNHSFKATKTRTLDLDSSLKKWWYFVPSRATQFSLLDHIFSFQFNFNSKKIFLLFKSTFLLNFKTSSKITNLHFLFSCKAFDHTRPVKFEKISRKTWPVLQIYDWCYSS